jgi:hypothetical protein
MYSDTYERKQIHIHKQINTEKYDETNSIYTIKLNDDKNHILTFTLLMATDLTMRPVQTKSA